MNRNDELRELLLKEARKELARNDYAEYCKYVHGGRWLLGKHLKLVCENVDKLINRDMRENILIVSMPPQ